MDRNLTGYIAPINQLLWAKAFGSRLFLMSCVGQSATVQIINKLIHQER